MRILRVEMKSYREDNESVVKSLEEKNQLNAAMMQILIDIQKRMNYGDRTVRPKVSKSTARRIKRSPSGSSKYEGSTGGSSSSSHENKRKRCYQNHSHDEFKKDRPSTFNGEILNNQKAES